VFNPKILNLFFQSKKNMVGKGIWSVEEFRAILERERARSDRSGDRFSLVVFDAEIFETRETLEHLLIEVLYTRIRPTDEVGWFDKAKVGVVLPDTPPLGARKLAGEICRKISVRTQPPTFNVYTYPSEKITDFKMNLKDIFSDEKDRTAETADDNAFGNIRILKIKGNIGRIESYFALQIPFWKRGIDIISSLLGLVLLFPLFLSISVLIKILSPGPVFFKQKRVGYLGQKFVLYKFRTMRVNADTTVHKKHVAQLIKDGKPLAKMDNYDSRIFPFGKFLRLTGLDELPQLINILKGEMSLIGPRPELLSSLRHCERWHAMRFDAKPGLSGLWQVSDKTTTTFTEMMRLDISYVKKMSFWLDAMIFLKTLPTVVKEAMK